MVRKQKMVRTRRIELPLPRGNRLLRPARLPVPPRPHVERISRILIQPRNFKTRIDSRLPAPAFGIMNPVESLVENLSSVQERITRAAARAGRNASEIKLVAVSKTHPVNVLNEALSAGISVFGENKVQEAESKILEIGREKAEWHLIGHL